MTEKLAQRHRVVIVGSGFGGLFAAKRLRHANVDVTLISRTTQHLFQPLLYQVATGILSEGEIAPATREILRRHKQRPHVCSATSPTSTSPPTPSPRTPAAPPPSPSTTR